MSSDKFDVILPSFPELALHVSIELSPETRERRSVLHRRAESLFLVNFFNYKANSGGGPFTHFDHGWITTDSLKLGEMLPSPGVVGNRWMPLEELNEPDLRVGGQAFLGVFEFTLIDELLDFSSQILGLQAFLGVVECAHESLVFHGPRLLLDLFQLLSQAGEFLL